jgi:signal transduction histidine kinase
VSTAITRVELRYEQDVVYARQRARQIADLLGFNRTDQTRISTAVSEIARNAYQYGGGGEIEFMLEGESPSQVLSVTVRDHGPGITDVQAILEGRYTSRTGMGMGIVGTRRLMDHFRLETKPDEGTVVLLGKDIPISLSPISPELLGRIAETLTRTQPESPLEEIRFQNQELLAALDQLRQRDEELVHVNRELLETNAGMVALYTDLETNARQLQQSELKLQERNAELKGFAYTVSHDLKAPLRGIAEYAEELTREHFTGLTERASFCLSQIITATRNLDRLVEELLHYSRLEQETPTSTEADLRRIVDTIISDRTTTLQELGTEISIAIEPSRLLCWELGMIQILTNLIDNAIKYSRKANPPHLCIKGEKRQDGYHISVADNGIGFDMKYHDRIFGLFNRLVRSEEYEGVGAGLAIVKRIVEKQHGRIWAESEPGKGATFHVSLPIEESQKHEPQEPKPPEEGHQALQ